RFTIEGHEYINFGSNNYLSLSYHPKVIEAARAATTKYGTGVTGSRLLNGTLDLHRRLENELADFYEAEGALVFSTGYVANISTPTRSCSTTRPTVSVCSARRDAGRRSTTACSTPSTSSRSRSRRRSGHAVARSSARPTRSSSSPSTPTR